MAWFMKSSESSRRQRKSANDPAYFRLPHSVALFTFPAARLPICAPVSVSGDGRSGPLAG